MLDYCFAYSDCRARASAQCPLCAAGVPHRKYGGMRILWEMHDVPDQTRLFLPCAASEVWLQWSGGEREWPIL